MLNRICVYAICKNEKKFVDKWLQSMSEADDIVVLDTGSTDGTYELLKKDPRVTRVEQKIISPWRFDVARNESLKLVTDANILVCTDFDEVFEPGWANILRSEWNENSSRALYKYIWGHDSNGNPTCQYTYDKIHKNGEYCWKRAVHEYLMRIDDKEENCAYDKQHSILVPIVLHHWQDLSKPRASYLDLLKLRVKDDPDDAYGWWYLGREYGTHNYPADEIECYNKAVEAFEKHPEKVDIFGMWMASYYNIGEYYKRNGDIKKAIENYQKAIYREAMYREPYLAIAELFNELHYYNLAIGYVNECLTKVPKRVGHWIEAESSWREKPYDILSVAYYNIGDIEKAKENVIQAYKYNPTDVRIAKNYKIITKEE